MPERMEMKLTMLCDQPNCMNEMTYWASTSHNVQRLARDAGWHFHSTVRGKGGGRAVTCPHCIQDAKAIKKQPKPTTTIHPFRKNLARVAECELRYRK